MNAVIVDGDAAYPPSSGKRLRTLNLMLRLARRHRITYIARCHDGPDAAKRAAAYSARTRSRDGPRRSPRPAQEGAGLLRPAGGQPVLAAAVLGGVVRQPAVAAGGAGTRGAAAGRCVAIRVDAVPGNAAPAGARPPGADRPQRRFADLAALPRDGTAAAAALVRPRPVAEIRALRAADVPAGRSRRDGERRGRRAGAGAVRDRECGCRGQRRRCAPISRPVEPGRAAPAGPRAVPGQPRLAAEPGRDPDTPRRDFPGGAGAGAVGAAEHRRPAAAGMAAAARGGDGLRGAARRRGGRAAVPRRRAA